MALLACRGAFNPHMLLLRASCATPAALHARSLAHCLGRASARPLSVRAFSSTVTPPDPKPEAPKPRGRRFGKTIMALTLITGIGAGTVIYDVLVNNTLQPEAWGLWDPEWDADWRPAGTAPHTGGARTAARELLLVRHGQYQNVSANDDELQGLTDLGKKQADVTGARLASVLKGKNVTVIHHSNMKRARETAQIIAAHFPGVELREDPMIAEGIPAFPDPPSRTFKPSQEDVQRDSSRIEQAFRKYFHRAFDKAAQDAAAAASGGAGAGKEEGAAAASAQSAQQKAKAGGSSYEIFVCHGNVIRYWFCRVLQFPGAAWLRLAVYNCGISWVTIDNQGYVSARQLGDVGHLPADMITYH